MSVEGRIAFGVYTAYFGGIIIISGFKPALWYPLLGGFVILMIGMYLILLRDRRRYNGVGGHRDETI
jgi:hypothetical protein